MEAGSRAWIAKTRAIQDLREAIRRVAQNLPVVNVELDQLPPLEELVVYYQPVVSLHDERVVSFEALIRWQHPERGLLFPDSFLPLAEATGFMVEIDRWVWEQAANQLLIWQRQFPSTPSLRMSVNLSPSDLSDPQLFAFIDDIFNRTGIAPIDFTFELTESVLLEDSDVTMDFLMKLKELGVEIALDDFGTAYSSLSYVQRFPFDRLKLDISFVSELPHSTRSLLLVEEICRMSASMKMRVIAEGIERQEQADVLVDIGCEFGQGYLFARPLSADNCTSFIAAHQTVN